MESLKKEKSCKLLEVLFWALFGVFSLLFIISIILYCCFNEDVYILIFGKNVLTLFPILFAVLIVCFLILKLSEKPYKEIIRKFLVPFWDEKRGLLLWLITVIVIILIISILINAYKSNNCDDFSCNDFSFSFNLASLLLCVFGIFLTSRVYLEIGREKTTNLNEYLEILTHIISNSKKDDILIIAPTIILGQTYKDENYIMNTYFDKILNYLKKGEIYFALLDFDYNNIPYLDVETVGDKYIYTINETKAEKFSGKKTLSDYHFETWNTYKLQYKNIKDFMIRLGDDLNALKNTGKANFIRLKPEMYLQKKEKKYIYTESEGFFAIANFNKGMYYMGTYKHQEKAIDFHGTYFENEHIKKEMQNMLKIVINMNIVTDEEERTKRMKIFT